MSGYNSRKVFICEDGERVTIGEFESEQMHRARAPQGAQGFCECRIQVCTVINDSVYKRESSEAGVCTSCRRRYAFTTKPMKREES
jgi:hypothetical protein